MELIYFKTFISCLLFFYIFTFCNSMMAKRDANSTFILFPFTFGLVASSIIIGFNFSVSPYLSLCILTSFIFLIQRKLIKYTFLDFIYVDINAILLFIISLIFLFTFSGKFVLAPIIGTWDGIVSYQRWAYELATDTYTPYSSFYQLGWPAIWSLFSQNEIYISTQFSKIFLIIEKLAFIFLLASYTQFKIRRLIISALYIWALILINQFWLFSGNVDSSLSLNIVNIILCCSFVVGNQTNQLKRASYINAAVCFFFFAILIKQQVIYIVPTLIYSLLYEKNYKLIDNSTIVFSIICFIGFVFNLIIFFEHKPDEVFDYMSDFWNASVQRAGPTFVEKITYGIIKTKNLFFHAANILLIIVWIWSKFFLRKKHHNKVSNYYIFDFILLLVVILGFSAYSFFYAYDNRGALWIASVLSTFLFVKCTREETINDRMVNFGSQLKIKINNFQIILVSSCALFFSILINIDASKNLTSSFGVTGKEGALLLKKYMDGVGNDCLFVINRDQIIKYNYLLADKMNKINNFNRQNTLSWNEERIIDFINNEENGNNIPNSQCGYLIYLFPYDDFKKLSKHFNLQNPEKNIFIYRDNLN